VRSHRLAEAATELALERLLEAKAQALAAEVEIDDHLQHTAAEPVRNEQK